MTNIQLLAPNRAKRLLAIGALLLLATGLPLHAATITVTSTADAGGVCPGNSCSLRRAIATAAAGDTIDFSLPAQSTINLTSGELLITTALTIRGPGADRLIARTLIRELQLVLPAWIC